MTYRNELEQAHRRIEQLEEQLQEERAKNEPPAPEPVEAAPTTERDALAPGAAARPGPVSTPASAPVPWWGWWPVAVVAASAIAYLVAYGAALPEPDGDQGIAFLLVSAFVGALTMSLEAVMRWRSGGQRTVVNRLLIVLACVTGGPALIAAVMVAGPVVGILTGVGACIWGLVKLVRWIARGKSD